LNSCDSVNSIHPIHSIQFVQFSQFDSCNSVNFGRAFQSIRFVQFGQFMRLGRIGTVMRLAGEVGGRIGISKSGDSSRHWGPMIGADGGTTATQGGVSSGITVSMAHILVARLAGGIQQMMHSCGGMREFIAKEISEDRVTIWDRW
jgi:hypothetical protein